MVKKHSEDTPPRLPADRRRQEAEAGTAGPRRFPGRTFWLAALVPIALLVAMTCRRAARPVDGLHSWGRGAWSSFARSHARYGLGYTKGIMTMAFGHPPAEEPERYFNHPQLDALLYGMGMTVLGIHDWTMPVMRIFLAVLGMLLFLKILRSLVDDWTALLAAALIAVFPITAYFLGGGWRGLFGFLAVWWYLVVTEQAGPNRKPTWRHFLALGVSLFLLLQIGWACFFYAASIVAHYVVRCVARREWPRAAVLAILLIVPLASAAVVFAIMAAGFDWDIGRMVDLYSWRVAEGEAARFEWASWLRRMWRMTGSNFTWPVLALAAGYLCCFVFARVAAFVRSRRGHRAVTTLRFPLLLVFLLPGILYMLILKGFFWQHQFAQDPLSPFLAIAAALAIVGIGRVLARAGKPVGWIGQIALVLLVGWTCVQGAEYYYSIKWHPPEKIAMWKELNRLTPPDKKLLSFDVQLDNLIVTQSKAKGPTYRGEPAWYIDREIVQAPSRETLQRSYQKVNIPYAKFVQIIRRLQEAYRSGRVSDQQARDIHNRTVMQMRAEVLAVLRQELPGLLDEIEQSRKTGQFTCYLTPAGYGQPAIGMLLQALNERLGRRYRTIRRIPSRQALNKDGQPVKAGEQIIQFGMRPYCIYDMTQPPKPTSAPATP